MEPQDLRLVLCNQRALLRCERVRLRDAKQTHMAAHDMVEDQLRFTETRIAELDDDIAGRG